VVRSELELSHKGWGGGDILYFLKQKKTNSYGENFTLGVRPKGLYSELENGHSNPMITTMRAIQYRISGQLRRSKKLVGPQVQKTENFMNE